MPSIRKRARVVGEHAHGDRRAGADERPPGPAGARRTRRRSGATRQATTHDPRERRSRTADCSPPGRSSLAESRGAARATSARSPAPPASSTERVRWASPPETQVDSGRAPQRRRRAPAISGDDRASVDAAERPRSAITAATAAPTGSTIAAPTSAPKRPAAKTSAAPAPPRRRNGHDRRGAVAGARGGQCRARPRSGTSTASIASSSLPIPKKRDPEPGVRPEQRERGQRRARRSRRSRTATTRDRAGDRQRRTSLAARAQVSAGQRRRRRARRSAARPAAPGSIAAPSSSISGR